MPLPVCCRYGHYFSPHVNAFLLPPPCCRHFRFQIIFPSSRHASFAQMRFRDAFAALHYSSLRCSISLRLSITMIYWCCSPLPVPPSLWCRFMPRHCFRFSFCSMMMLPLLLMLCCHLYASLPCHYVIDISPLCHADSRYIFIYYFLLRHFYAIFAASCWAAMCLLLWPRYIISLMRGVLPLRHWRFIERHYAAFIDFHFAAAVYDIDAYAIFSLLLSLACFCRHISLLPFCASDAELSLSPPRFFHYAHFRYAARSSPSRCFTDTRHYIDAAATLMPRLFIHTPADITPLIFASALFRWWCHFRLRLFLHTRALLHAAADADAMMSALLHLFHCHATMLSFYRCWLMPFDFFADWLRRHFIFLPHAFAIYFFDYFAFLFFAICFAAIRFCWYYDADYCPFWAFFDAHFSLLFAATLRHAGFHAAIAAAATPSPFFFFSLSWGFAPAAISCLPARLITSSPWYYWCRLSSFIISFHFPSRCSAAPPDAWCAATSFHMPLYFSSVRYAICHACWLRHAPAFYVLLIFFFAMLPDAPAPAADTISGCYAPCLSCRRAASRLFAMMRCLFAAECRSALVCDDGALEMLFRHTPGISIFSPFSVGRPLLFARRLTFSSFRRLADLSMMPPRRCSFLLLPSPDLISMALSSDIFTPLPFIWCHWCFHFRARCHVSMPPLFSPAEFSSFIFSSLISLSD